MKAILPILTLSLAILGCSSKVVSEEARLTPKVVNETLLPNPNYTSTPRYTYSGYDTITISPSQREIARGLNNFAIDLAKKISEKPSEENYIYSPLGMAVVIDMIANGADSVVKNETLKLLGQKDKTSLSSLNDYLSLQLGHLNNQSENSNSIFCNSVWIDKSFHPEIQFIDTCTQVFNAEIFDNIKLHTSKVMDEINQWAGKRTKGMIPKLLEEPLDPTIPISFTNVIYLKILWDNEFDPALTKPHTFKNSNGIDGMCDMMRINNLNLNYKQTDTHEIVRFPLNDNKYRIDIVLPKEGYTIKDCLPSLNGNDFDIYPTILFNSAVYDTIMMPKWELECELIFYKELREAGIKSIFDNNKTRFENMSKGELKYAMSPILQKSKIIVNEKGAEAAVVTTEFMITSSGFEPREPEYRKLIIDRPFMFVITENKSDIILFIGEIRNLNNAK